MRSFNDSQKRFDNSMDAQAKPLKLPRLYSEKGSGSCRVTGSFRFFSGMALLPAGFLKLKCTVQGFLGRQL